MRPVKADIQIENNLGGKSIAMTVDTASLYKLQDILTNLYSDTELAVIRELASNAWDSHVEAGNTNPIRVSTPGRLSDKFIVQDWGVGMSPQDLEEVFSKYGKSTKEHTDDLVGMLGLGCKAPLAYTNRFEIIAIKQGVRTTAVVALNEEGVGNINIIDTRATQEPNGVTITVPAKWGHNFHTKAEKFFKYWPQGSVLLNDQEPKRDFKELIPGVRLAEKDYYDSQAVVVMGNVPYPVTDGHFDWLPYGKQLVIEAPIGSVIPVPSREALKYNPHTVNYLKQRSGQIKQEFAQVARKKVVSIKNKAERYKAWRDVWSPFLQGVKAADLNVETKITVDITTYRSGANPSTYNSISLEDFYYRGYYQKGAVLVKNFGTSNLTTYQRRKLNHWAETNSLGYVKFYVYRPDEIPGDGWLEFDHVLDWDEAKKIKLPNTRKGSKSKEKYYLRSNSSQRSGDHTADEILAISDEVLLLSTADSQMLYTLQDHFDMPVVMEGKNRWEKFKRNFEGDAYTYEELLTQQRQEIVDGLTDADKRALAGVTTKLPLYDSSKIESKELRAKLEAFNADKPSAMLGRAREFNNIVNYIDRSLPRGQTSGISRIVVNNPPKMDYPLADFPLLSGTVYGTLRQEHYDYINALTLYRSGQTKDKI